ncbi:DNA/RNA polymerase [Durotheca rogersii]|uniref:DNA/RNA polymerase n=1 Tax=Durotheca rogersii TaxID=419775 RepID=UPI002220C506|nr:DNA/RNA polymerase [Durotheca rogersii]KAI5868489.1 DNA/RNA polymerase [Durotheca rogersii]
MMFLRPPPVRRSLLSSPLGSARWRQSVARHTSLQSLHMSSPKLLIALAEALPRRRKMLQDVPGPAFRRPLATAIGDPTRQGDIAFAHLQPPIPADYPHPSSSHLRPYDLRAFDPSSPLLIKIADNPTPRARTSPHGVPGGIEEMLSLFDAYIQVGKPERAALVLERFSEFGLHPGYDLTSLHNRYLRASIDRAFEQPNSKWARSLHRWYELHIRGKRIPQTSETIACMLKVSLLSARGPQLSRLVDRYMGMMPEDGIYQVLSEVEILSQQDFGTITSIYKPASDILGGLGFESLQEPHQGGSDHASAERPGSDTVPEVRPVPQKGLGLKSLRGVLSFFTKIEGQDISKLSLAERREIQSRLEEDSVEAAINRWKEENKALAKIGLSTVLSQPALNAQLYEWHCALEQRMEEELVLVEESEARDRKRADDQDRCIYGPFLKQSTPPRLAAVTIMGVLNGITTSGSSSGAPLSTLLNSIAKMVEDDIKHQKVQKKQDEFKANLRERKKAYKLAKSSATAPTTTETPTAPTETPTASNIVKGPVFETRTWPVLIRTKVGAALLAALIDVAKVNIVREDPEKKILVSQIQPALTHTTVFRKGKKVGVLIPNKFLLDLMKREPRGEFLARHLPMLVEPEPWTKFDKGGFIQYPSHLVRVKNGEKDQRVYAEAALERGDMEQVTKGLDVLGRTGWRVNNLVLNVMLEAWNTGEGIANIPPLNPNIPIPPEPTSNDNPIERRTWIKAVKVVENTKSGLHSERCFMNFQLEIARAFKDQTFYFPHNMDFRGRAYPIPAYLNHMGADHVRGLLCFAKGKELGKRGLRWLKIHLANVFGYDKASLTERESFATEHLDDIQDTVTNPLTGKRWWLEAEDPWQCLATCFELKAALDSGDPTKFVSHLAIHQDGTCNGLQHYAALGGDTWGAQQVNLEPGDRPADVYSAVAEMVKESIAKDLEVGNDLAKAVEGKITRKVVKQTVMTNVYGVTFIGAKAQVLRQLDAAHPKLKEETGVSTILLASYIATKIFEALSTMFRGAHDIQYWLGECAARVCRSITAEQIDRIANGEVPVKKKKTGTAKSAKSARSGLDELLVHLRSTIVWTTPLRMPVVQPYRKSGVRVITTSLQDLTLQIPDRSDPVHRRKQLQAFPPNFIHSLDASHMLLSALECGEVGLTFAAVHDSFWTHAADVDVMNRVLRDCFIRIHSEDVIGRLASEFRARHKDSLYLATIARNSKVGRAIAALRRRTKISIKDELVLELERQRLLRSSDPEEVEKGKAMETPARIFDELSAAQPLSSGHDMEELGLGNIPKGSTASESEPSNVEDGSTTLDSDDVDVGSRSGNAEYYKALRSTTPFESQLSGTDPAKAKPKPSTTKSSIWLPLVIPDIPQKGEFDVRRLKDSQYFFS